MPTCLGKTKIFYANSYNEGFFWTGWIVNGFEDVLKKNGYKLETQHGFLNAFTESKLAQKERARKVLKQIKLFNPDLIICTDDDAMALVCLNIRDRKVIFTGINGMDKYLSSEFINSLSKPGHNMTGIFQKTYYSESLNLIKKLFPKARTFAVVKDLSTTSNEQFKELQAEKTTLPLKLIKMIESNKYEIWQEKSKELALKVDVIFYLNANSVFDKNGKQVQYTDVYRWLGNNIKIPTVGTWRGQIENGLLLSASDDGPNQGIYAAYLALKILEGTSPGSLEIKSPPNGIPIINIGTVKKLKIQIKQEHMNIFIDNGKIYGK